MSLRGWTWLAAIVLCIAAWGGIVYAVGVHNEHMRDQGRSEVRQAWSQAVAAENVRQAEDKARRDRLQKEADDAHAQALDRARADAAGARDAADRVQRQLATFLASRRDPAQGGAPAGHGTGEQGSDALDLLAGLLGGGATALIELGEHADALRAAGERCERGYDAEVTP